MISSKKNFVFVHIPKTAGSSVTYCLRHEFDRENRVQRFVNSISKRISDRKIYEITRFQPLPNHATAAEYLACFGDRYWSMKSFSFVRNPYDLMVSLFFFVQQTPQHHDYEKVQGLSFRDYVLQTFHPDRPESRQARFLVDDEGRCLVQKIGRVETVSESFAEITRHLGINAELPHLNKSKRGSYLQHYDDETIDLVARVFRTDFELLGYSRDPNCTDVTPIQLEPHPKLLVH